MAPNSNEGESAMRFEHDGPAVVVRHCSVSGRSEWAVRKVSVGDPEKYAQYPIAVCVRFLEPRKRLGAYVWVTCQSLDYVTILVGGREVYDSRADVPCDMAKWEETAARFKKDPAWEIHHRHTDGTVTVEGPKW